MPLGHPMIVQPTFHPCTREYLLSLLFLKVLLYTSKCAQLSANMSVADWTFYLYNQNNTISHDHGNETWGVYESWFKRPVENLNGMFGFVSKVWSFGHWFASAQADVNFWENNWSHILEMCGPPSDMIAENHPHISSTQLAGAIFQCFMLFEGSCGMVLSCGSVSSTCPALVISSYLCLSLIVEMCIIMAAAIDAWKPSVSNRLCSAFNSRFTITTSIYNLCFCSVSVELIFSLTCTQQCSLHLNLFFFTLTTANYIRFFFLSRNVNKMSIILWVPATRGRL